jgi:hypothetical protein
MTARSTGNTRWFRARRFWVWAVVFVVLMALVGGTWGWLSDRALGVEAGRPGSAPAVAQLVPTSEQCCSADVRRFARRAARKFRSGGIRRDHGFRPGAVYRAPRQVREVWVSKIHRWILAHPGHLRTLSARRVGGRACYPSSRCYAAGLYADAVAHASCVTGSYPAASQGACDRAPWHNGPGLTKRQVQDLGSVVLCGGGVALGVATAPPTRGGSVAFVAFWGALACGWSFWTAVDPGGGGSW